MRLSDDARGIRLDIEGPPTPEKIANAISKALTGGGGNEDDLIPDEETGKARRVVAADGEVVVFLTHAKHGGATIMFRKPLVVSLIRSPKPTRYYGRTQIQENGDGAKFTPVVEAYDDVLRAFGWHPSQSIEKPEPPATE